MSDLKELSRNNSRNSQKLVISYRKGSANEQSNGNYYGMSQYGNSSINRAKLFRRLKEKVKEF